jgi:uncharacterized protein
MTTPISDLQTLLRTMDPVLNDGVYAFVSLPHGTDTSMVDAVATVREQEGLTLIVKEELALVHQWPILFRAAWVTLKVHSDLSAVGLPAAVAGALTRADISCNVLAGACHDHIFVPIESAAQAIGILRDVNA